MDVGAVEALLNRFTDYPRFPDGRIDFHDAPAAAVVVVLCEYEGTLLLMKRSDEVHTYQGKWMVVAGYLDEIVSPEEKALEEFEEETGHPVDAVLERVSYPVVEYTDDDIDTTFHIFPVKLVLGAPIVPDLDLEHTEFAWVPYDQVKGYDTVPNLSVVLEHVGRS